MKGRVFLIHWDQTEAAGYAQALNQAGWETSIEFQNGARARKRILSDPPNAVIIYLSRLPSHGRETALGLRYSPAGKLIPVIFVGGTPATIKKTREKVPDALFTTTAGLMNILARFALLND